MLIIPAVDIKGGKAVRLVQGRADRETVYDDDPVHAALRWVQAGVRRLHVVDLDGAFGGEPKNAEIIYAIMKEIPDTEIEVGGGVRSQKVVSAFLEKGAARCVIGTKAVEDREFLKDLSRRFPGRICVGVDAKDGNVVTKGWVEQSSLAAVDLVSELYGLPLAEVIYTDVARDGMLQGPNLKRLKEIKQASSFPLIASGGVTTLENIRSLRKMGCFGCIIGKALYDGRLKLADALKAASETKA